MFIDKQGKLFGKISIIDIIVILAILVAGFGMYTRFTSGNIPGKEETKPQKIEYTVKIRGVRDGNVKALEKGGRIFESSTEECLGEITKAVASPAVEYRTVANGEVVKMEVPEKYDVILTVQTDSQANSSGYYLSEDITMSVGSGFNFYTKYSRIEGEIMSIREI